MFKCPRKLRSRLKLSSDLYILNKIKNSAENFFAKAYIDTNNSSDSDEENKTGFQREMLDYEIIDEPSIRIKF